MYQRRRRSAPSPSPASAHSTTVSFSPFSFLFISPTPLHTATTFISYQPLIHSSTNFQLIDFFSCEHSVAPHLLLSTSKPRMFAAKNSAEGVASKNPSRPAINQAFDLTSLKVGISSMGLAKPKANHATCTPVHTFNLAIRTTKPMTRPIRRPTSSKAPQPTMTVHRKSIKISDLLNPVNPIEHGKAVASPPGARRTVKPCKVVKVSDLLGPAKHVKLGRSPPSQDRPPKRFRGIRIEDLLNPEPKFARIGSLF